MSYKRIKVYNMKGDHVGYLSNLHDFTTQAAVISDLKDAYKYQFVQVEGGLRLDQETSGGDRSLTYSSNGFYPCWGLGPNWIVLTYGDDHTIIYKDGNTNYYLGRGLFNQGPAWSPSLGWIDQKFIDGTTREKLIFEFDEG